MARIGNVAKPRFSICIFSFSLALVLTGCGGGGGGIVSTPTPPATPTPSPTPSPTPTPTPTPSAVVQPFPSSNPPTAYSTVNVSVNANVTTAPSPNGAQRVTGITSLTSVGTPSFGSFEYRGPDNYAVEFGGFGGPVFDPDEKVASSEAYELFYDFAWEPYFANLELARRDRGIQFTYLTFGSVMAGIDRPDHGEITFFVAGSQTPDSQMPRSGSATYTGIADGLWIDGSTVRRLYGSSATLTADFGSGQVTSTLNLAGRSDPFGAFTAGQLTTLGVFNGTGAISGRTFDGSYAPTAGYSGPFTGTFFGPAAEEYGLSFRLNGGVDQSVIGVAAGKK